MTSGARLAAAMLGLSGCLLAQPAHAQRLTDTSDQTLSIVLPLNTLTPGTSATPASLQMQFRLRSGSLTGYRVTASVSFTSTLAAPLGGGATLSAGDIGVGITQVDTSPLGVLKPRTDTIASGFAYDPGTVVAVNGLTSFSGRASGQATLQDIVNNPGISILSGPTIGLTDLVLSDNFLTVTMRFAVHRQYFTPASVSAVLTLTIVNQ
jgi:hypothetical protein